MRETVQEQARKPAKRRWRVVVVLCALVIVVAVVAFWPGEKEPEYEGKKLSEWLAARIVQPEEATNAVLAIGTNALPFLVKWVEYEIPEWREKVANMTRTWPRWTISFWVARKALGRGLDQRAEFGFLVLGEQAAPAIPELSRYVRDPKVRSHMYAAYSLAYLGPGAVAPLVAALEDKGQSKRRRWEILCAITKLKDRGPEIHKTIPVLISCLEDTNGFVGAVAASTIGSFLVEPEQCIPALTKAAVSVSSQTRRSAIQALGNFGAPAGPVVNVISN